MDALANGWVGGMDMARCRPERQRKGEANEGDGAYILVLSYYTDYTSIHYMAISLVDL